MRVRARVDALRYRRLLGDVERYAMFVGYGRSGSSIMGSLLTAHPDALIANELDALQYVAKGWRREELYARLLARDREYAAGEVRSGRYDYGVPGQWQGRFRTLRVIGDKKASTSVVHLIKDPSLIDRLKSTVAVPVRLIHVVRNPFDNIATLYRRGRPPTLERAKSAYFRNAEAVVDIERRAAPEEWFELRHEDFVADPADTMRRLCEFLELEPHADYLEACASIVHESPNRSRDGVEWTPELVEEIAARARALPFLSHYMAEDELPVPASA